MSATQPATPAAPVSTPTVPLERGVQVAEPSDFQIDWEAVDAALQLFREFDLIDLAKNVIEKSLESGSQNAYNEAGGARFQVAKLRQNFQILKDNICRETIDSKLARIAALEAANKKKRLIVAPESC